MHGEERAPDVMTLGAFAIVVVLGAGNFLAVRFSNMGLPPFWGAGLRFSIAAATFVAIVLALRLRWPRGQQLRLTIWYGVLSFGLFFALMYWALDRVTAGVATVVMAIVPLATLLLAVAQRQERLHARAAVGAVLAMAGISWMTLVPQDVVLPLTALAAMIGAAMSIGQSIIVGKRVSANHPAVTNAVGMSVGAVLLLGFSAVVGETWSAPGNARAFWAVAYLVTFGSVGLFVLVLLVVRRWTASATSYAFVLFPVVTMTLEAVIAGEPVTAAALAGAVLVMLGVWFGALSPGARRASTPAVQPIIQPMPAPEVTR